MARGETQVIVQRAALEQVVPAAQEIDRDIRILVVSDLKVEAVLLPVVVDSRNGRRNPETSADSPGREAAARHWGGRDRRAASLRSARARPGAWRPSEPGSSEPPGWSKTVSWDKRDCAAG